MATPITIRLLDIFRIGLGPSSSHTVGPMRAAALFRRHCLEKDLMPDRLRIELKGSLSATGRGHGTDRAVLAGLHGWNPETCDVDAFQTLTHSLSEDPWIDWGAERIKLHPDDVVFLRYVDYKDETLAHPNTMCCSALDKKGDLLHEESWCSIGGGFVSRAEDIDQAPWAPPSQPPRFPFGNAEELTLRARQEGCTLGDIVLANEVAWEGSARQVTDGLDRVWEGFKRCVDRGLAGEGELPGGLRLQRRAGFLLEEVNSGKVDSSYQHIARAQAYSYAVNEENAAGGRVVTAPTNGAAGILPGVLLEAADRLNFTSKQIRGALATAGAIAMLIKTHASISGAEIGCQGEVGSATAMAAAALCELLGGTIDQVEYAAEIAIEHNLGLTCDPLKGLVQAPCIERNAMGVAKAWSAAQLALHSGAGHLISLDRVIKVMKRTGDDMAREYKETSEGGLAAVSLPEC
jgi:L-serine dehydratase